MADNPNKQLRDRLRRGHLRSRLHNGVVQFAFGILVFGTMPFAFALALTVTLMSVFHVLSVPDRFAETKDRSGVIHQVGKIALYVALQAFALLASAWVGLRAAGYLDEILRWLQAALTPTF